MFHPVILIADLEQRLVLGELGCLGDWFVEQEKVLQHFFSSLA
jgi:hypothetical protein